MRLHRPQARTIRRPKHLLSNNREKRVSNLGTGRSAVGLLCAHWHVELVMHDRQDIDIDYCQKCRGARVDCSELGTIIKCRAPLNTSPIHDSVTSPPQSFQPGTVNPRLALTQGLLGDATSAPPPLGRGQKCEQYEGCSGGSVGCRESHVISHSRSRGKHRNWFLGRQVH